MANKTITIFGGTGTSAGGAVRQFLEAGWNVRAVTRDTESEKAKALAAKGATVVPGDLDVRSTLYSAIEGADALYLVTPSLGNRWDIGQAVQGINVADAAAEVGIGHLIYQSAITCSARGVLSVGSKRAIEERIAELELPATITRPTLFMDNFLTYFPPQPEGDGLTIAMAIPLDKPQSMVSSDDIGRAAVAVASDPAKHIGKEYDLVADMQSLAGMAQAIEDVTGKKTTPIPVPIEALDEHWPQGANLYRWLTARQDQDDTAALPSLIGKPVDFRQWVAANLA